MTGVQNNLDTRVRAAAAFWPKYAERLEPLEKLAAGRGRVPRLWETFRAVDYRRRLYRRYLRSRFGVDLRPNKPLRAMDLERLPRTRYEREMFFWGFHNWLQFEMARACAKVALEVRGNQAFGSLLFGPESRAVEFYKARKWKVPAPPTSEFKFDPDRAAFEGAVWSFRLKPLIDALIMENFSGIFLAPYAAALKKIVRSMPESVAERLDGEIIDDVLASWYMRQHGRWEAAVREQATIRLAGWVRTQINLGGEPGQRIRNALSGTSEGSIYERLVQELPATVRIAFDERLPGEPFRPTGERQTNFVSRVADELEDLGGEATKRPEKLTSLETGHTPGSEDELLAEFERQTTLEQQSDQLSKLEELTAFPPREGAVWHRIRRGMEVVEIATELGMTKNNVYVHTHNAIKRLSKARKAAGL